MSENEMLYERLKLKDELYRKAWYDMINYLKDESNNDFEMSSFHDILCRMLDIYSDNYDNIKKENKFL